MKVTRIIMVAIACLALTAGTTKAQNGRLSVGAELAMPMGDFGDAVGIGFGGTLGYEYPIGDAMGLGLRAGYMSFSGKDGGPSETVIPAQAFFKYYFQEQQSGFYAMANLGIHSSSVKFDGESISSTDLSYAPELGYHLANIDLGLRYQIISGDGGSSSYIGVRLAYVFGEK